MPGGDGFYPPTMYAPIWAILGTILLVLVAAWYLFVWWFSNRKHRMPQPAPAVDPLVEAARLKGKYYGLIEEVEKAWRAEELSTRAAHQKLGTLVRFYVFESSGRKAQVMTLEDLNQANLRSVADAVEQYYPAEFAAVEQGDVPYSADVAREVVGTWS
ncbi:hypothetical protein [Mycetocola miduiensis]|uniref:DUF4381 domain-containing protein n=1 Tax=Mycetocola miduiensis TaxID=995034 RepID=A0A1I5BNZ8_9MICO|nr:hypothetical protein [Mycetocola miduiensis]SFN76380.1 hypothetical protein SAMN05216219_2007 [Mycetocola miduiensis]